MTNENTSPYDICFGSLYNYNERMRLKCKDCTILSKEECIKKSNELREKIR